MKKILVFSFLLLLISFAGIVLAADAGKALPADGGDPGKAYMAYHKAIVSGDLDSLKKLVTAEQVKSMDDPDFKKMFPMMQSMTAKDIKITGGTMNGNAATLNAEGTDPMGGGKTKGTIQMVLEDKQWKVKEDSWKGEMK